MLKTPESAYISNEEPFSFSIKAKSDSVKATSFINSLVINRYDEVHYLVNGSVKKIKQLEQQY